MTPLRAWRRRLGLTQAALAAHLGGTIRTVSRWETGEREPDPWIWLALAAIEAKAELPPEAPRTRAEAPAVPT